METFINWLTSLNWTSLATIIVGWLTANVGTLLGLVIALIKTRVNKTGTEEEIQASQVETLKQVEELIAKLETELLSAMDENQKAKLAEMVEQSEARLKAINDAANASDKADEKLDNADIDTMLDSVEDK